MGDILIAVAWTALEFVLVSTGALAVRLVTQGRWKNEGLNSTQYMIHAAAGGLTFMMDGRRVVTTTGQTVVGAAIWVAVIGISIYFWK
jgi:hypothetical protein